MLSAIFTNPRLGDCGQESLDNWHLRQSDQWPFANSLVGWIGGFYETMPTTTFWLLHAGCALGSGLCFVAFKFIAGHHLEAEA